MLQDLGEELTSLPLSHGQVVKQTVATVARCSTRHLPLIISNELERASHEVSDVLWLEITA